MLKGAIVAVVVSIICYSGTYLWGRTMADRPLIVASLIGLLMGDLHTGLVCGATLEAIFLGVSHIGGSNLNYCMASIFTTIFACTTTGDFESIFAMAVPIGTLGILVETGYRFISALFTGYMDRLVAKNEQAKFSTMRYVIFLLTHPIYWIVVFLGVYFGAEFIQKILDILPSFINDGLSVSKGLFGAIGLALVLNQIWDKKICYFFFLGFVLYQYLNLPVMAVLVIAICFALVIVSRDIEINKLKNCSNNAISSEEDFLK